MKTRKILTTERILLLILAGILAAAVLLMVSSKENWFMDEALSYLRANNQTGFPYLETQKGEDLFVSFYSPVRRFDYRQVFLSESQNVHPPLFYYALHTVSSLFAGQFSYLFAGVINLIFAVFTLLALNQVLKHFMENLPARMIVLLAWILSPGTLTNVSYLRMYVMLGFFITALLALYLSDEEKRTRLYWLKLGAVVYCGFLTHYHFLFYLAAASLTYLVLVLIDRKKKLIPGHIVTIGIACFAAFLSFPPMIRQITASDRGMEAGQNIRNIGEFLSRLRWFGLNAGWELFGSINRYIVLLTAACVVFLLVLRIRGRKRGKKTADGILLVVPALLFFGMVSITASFTALRYLYAIYPLLLVSVFVIFYRALQRSSFLRKISVPVLLIAAALITWRAQVNADYPWLYRGDAEKRDALSDYRDLDCIYLLQSRDMALCYIVDCPELSLYRTVTLAPIGEEDWLRQHFSGKQKLIVVTDDGFAYQSDDLQGEITELAQNCGLPDKLTDLGKYSEDTHTYCLERQDG